MRYFLLTVVSLLTLLFSNAQIAVSTDGSTPHASAMLEVKSTNRGLLLPRLTDVQKNAIASPATGLMIYETTSNALWVYNGTAWVQLGSGGSLSSWTVAGNNIYNANTGNVGIGTTSPTSKFHVQGNLLLTEGDITINDDFGSVYFRNGTINRAYVQLRGADFDMQLGTLGLNTTGNLILQTQGANRMTIAPNGNVGVGFTNPGTKLDVNGSVHTAGRIDADGVVETRGGISAIGGAGMYITGTSLLEGNITAQGTLTVGSTVSVSGNINSNTSMTITDPAAILQLRSNSSTELGFMHLSGDNVRIGTNSGNNLGKFIIRTNGGDRVFVDNAGNVSIGTSDVANGYRVSVAGKVMCEEVRVQLRGAWPDYVFSKNYRLMTLKELENFIASNQHLPNIPSATQVEKEGIAVGDMQKRMMEKIEELTLYIIQQQKEIDALKATLQTIQKH